MVRNISEIYQDCRDHVNFCAGTIMALQAIQPHPDLEAATLLLAKVLEVLADRHAAALEQEHQAAQTSNEQRGKSWRD